jgi:hypothetical protein
MDHGGHCLTKRLENNDERNVRLTLTYFQSSSTKVVDRIPVYILNALYLGPLTLWTYIKYGRPPIPTKGSSAEAHHEHHEDMEASPVMDHSKMDHEKMDHGDMDHSQMDHTHMDHSRMQHDQKKPSTGKISHAHMHGASPDVPMFATVTVAVCHCGSGCLLGDLIGEWIVFGTGAMINGKEIWVEFLLGECLYCSY